MRTLVIGGTRNLGPALVQDLLADGHRVAVLNRGRTPDDLPAEVERLRADRTDAAQLARAVGGRDFDLIVDTTLYAGTEAAAAVARFNGRVGRYVFLSTGQVYLVREGGIARPFREADYAGPVMAEPDPAGPDHAEWRYGVEKRAAEDVFAEAFTAHGFPFVSLRLPMVNGERDHYDRLRNYLFRLDDGGPIVAPGGPAQPLRHVDARDVVAAIRIAATHPRASGRAWNVSQDEAVDLDGFLSLLGELAARPVRLVRVPRSRLEGAGLLPAASPFSGRWMSELDNRSGVAALGLRYTPLRDTLARLVAHHRAHPALVPAGYAQRTAELALALASEAGAEMNREG